MKKNPGYYVSDESSVVFAAKEAYRTIRANLMFSLAKVGCRTIVVSSSIPGEGKTTASANVAFSIARSNKKVLLIDMDLRCPNSHMGRLVKRPNTPGLTNFLSGFNTLEEVLHKEVFPNLDVICSGSLSPNPSEMVSSDMVSELLKKMQAHYDFIIIDTPPINFVSDALSLIRQADGAVLVVRPNYTARSDLRKTVDQIELAGGKILGVIVNGVQDNKRRYGRYGHSYYGYGNVPQRQQTQQAQAEPETKEEAKPEETQEQEKTE